MIARVLTGNTFFSFRACIWGLAVFGNTTIDRMIIVIIWANTIGAQSAVTVRVRLANVAIWAIELWVVTGIFPRRFVFTSKFRANSRFT